VRTTAYWIGVGILSQVLGPHVAAAGSPAAKSPTQEPVVTITYLYDNTAAAPGVTADWGFSCLVEGHGARVLFDTGTKPEILTHNARALRVDLRRLDAVVLSHDHGDHTAGFPALGPRPGLPVFYAQGFNPTVVAALRGSGAKLVPVSKSVQVLPGFRTSDEFGTTIREEALIVDARDGLVVIVGCSHPGIVTMLRQIKTSSGRPIHTIVGGFHLGQASADEVARIVADVRELGLVRVGATHCTGAEAIRVFKGAYGGHFIPGGVGTVVTARQ
jgi:7,8-dihydropterin-6-yl-methyl-4-(beta-D-ribofuranosyl)aminobenzene 5'-phosphate synthase